jgi:DNA-binding NtrC family response regulator
VPAQIVIVHDDDVYLLAATDALKEAGHDVTPFNDPMVALDALTEAHAVQLLITRVAFVPGKPHGIAVARMARMKLPGIKVLFTALPKYAEHAEGLGAFMPTPVDLADLVAVVERLLEVSARPI